MLGQQALGLLGHVPHPIIGIFVYLLGYYLHYFNFNGSHFVAQVDLALTFPLPWSPLLCLFV